MSNELAIDRFDNKLLTHNAGVEWLRGYKRLFIFFEQIIATLVNQFNRRPVEKLT